MMLTFDDKPETDGDFYAQYLFMANHYFENKINYALLDQPIVRSILPIRLNVPISFMFLLSSQENLALR